MTTTTFKSIWIERYQKELTYYEDKPRYFDKWERSRMPESRAECNLTNALHVLFGNGGAPVADKFLIATIEVVNRALEEDKFNSPLCQGGFPMNRAEALRVRSYAKAILGRPLPVDDLAQASLDYEEWCKDHKRSEWDSQAQAYYLNAVRISLLAGDHQRVASLLKSRRSFKWHAEELGILKDLTAESDALLPLENMDLRDRLTAFLDRIRDPRFQPDVFLELELVRLEWGAIYYKYFLSRGEIIWADVIDLLSK